MQNTCNFFLCIICSRTIFISKHMCRSSVPSFFLFSSEFCSSLLCTQLIEFFYRVSEEMRWNAYVGGWFGFVNQVEFGIRRKGSFLWRWWYGGDDGVCVVCVEGEGEEGRYTNAIYIDVFITLRTLVYMVGIMDTDVSFGH